MTQRLDWFRAAPQGTAALIGVEKYLENCGLEHKLLALVKIRVSQMNGLIACTCTPPRPARPASRSRASIS